MSAQEFNQKMQHLDRRLDNLKLRRDRNKKNRRQWEIENWETIKLYKPIKHPAPEFSQQYSI